MSASTSPPHAPVLTGIQPATWARALTRSPLRRLVAVAANPDILSLAGGLPDPHLFPVAQLSAAIQHVLATDPQALQYRPPFEPLRNHVVALMARRGVTCAPEQIFFTTGAQQALDILARLLIEPGQPLLLERFIYTGIQQAVGIHRPTMLPLNTDFEDGLDVDEVAAYLAAGERPAFLYTIPEGHNPTGVTLSAARRSGLVDLARRYGLPIVEDDPYGLLYYNGGDALPALRAQEEEWVLYCGSFSKIIAPALRLGWIVVPPGLTDRLTVIKEAGDLENSALTQRAVSAFFDSGAFAPHLALLRSTYGARRDALLAALQVHFPAAARWTQPAGGMFVWVELPAGMDAEVLLAKSLASIRVAFVPGSAFALPGTPAAARYLRLTFASVTPERIHEGIGRLGALLHDLYGAGD